jgi:phosphate/sulfate permease
VREIVQAVVVIGFTAVSGTLIGILHARFTIKSGRPYRWYHSVTAGLLTALVWLALQWLMGM